jgi:hypothetical protein
MTQALYAHMNNKKKNERKKRRVEEREARNWRMETQRTLSSLRASRKLGNTH